MKSIFIKKSIVNNTDHPEVLSVKFNCSTDVRNRYFLKDEFLQQLVKLKLIGVRVCILESVDIYSLYEILVKVLPDIRQIFPVRINLDYKATSLVFLKNIKSIVDGFQLDLKIPLKQAYTEDEKFRYGKIYQNDTFLPIYQYRDNMLNVISLIDDMKLTIYRTATKDLTEDDVEYVLKFAKELKGDYFLDKDVM